MQCKAFFIRGPWLEVLQVNFAGEDRVGSILHQKTIGSGKSAIVAECEQNYVTGLFGIRAGC